MVYSGLSQVPQNINSQAILSDNSNKTQANENVEVNVILVQDTNDVINASKYLGVLGDM